MVVYALKNTKIYHFYVVFFILLSLLRKSKG